MAERGCGARRVGLASRSVGRLLFRRPALGPVAYGPRRQSRASQASRHTGPPPAARYCPAQTAGSAEQRFARGGRGKSQARRRRRGRPRRQRRRLPAMPSAEREMPKIATAGARASAPIIPGSVRGRHGTQRAPATPSVHPGATRGTAIIDPGRERPRERARTPASKHGPANSRGAMTGEASRSRRGNAVACPAPKHGRPQSGSDDRRGEQEWSPGTRSRGCTETWGGQAVGQR